MQSDKPRLEFPCRFAIKAMGLDTVEFKNIVMKIILSHAPDVAEQHVSSRHSKGGKYVSITVHVNATSQAQLDNIYRELSACQHVTMVL